MYQRSDSPEPAHRVVGIRFRPAGRVYYYDPAGYQLKVGQWVIVESTKGLECGRVVILPRQVEVAELGSAELKPVIRLAEEDDLRRMLSFKAREKEALRRCAQRIAQHDLPMKLAEAEYTFDGSRLTFYFTADERVDFRALVRDLAATFHTRIELRQIGARDHAKLLGGVGMCGKTLCCSSWLTEFNVVSIRMAKEQGLPLNTSKISGVCGRLLCCLAYENDNYIEAKAHMPAYNETVITPSGQGHVVGINVPRDSVEVMLESGATITIPVRELGRYEPRIPPTALDNGHPPVQGCGSCAHNTANIAAHEVDAAPNVAVMSRRTSE
ncbi:MAG TPA: stage 0 sporulation family protein [Ktedonobacterales bacterium]|nr:stage 0 sporulation family protein [Ktedonobacterales bacterium]